VYRGGVRLAGVLDDHEAVRLGKWDQPIHVGGIAIEMHRHDSFCARCDGVRHLFRVEVIGVRITIHEDRRRANEQYRVACRGETEGAR
jgi:hypothetical protein